jgi:hypothetical protein
VGYRGGAVKPKHRATPARPQDAGARDAAATALLGSYSPLPPSQKGKGINIPPSPIPVAVLQLARPMLRYGKLGYPGVTGKLSTCPLAGTCNVDAPPGMTGLVFLTLP